MPGNELETHQEVSSNNKFDLHQHFGCRLSMTSSNLLGVWCSTRPKNCLPTNGMFQVCSICLLIIRYRRNPKFENNMYNCITCIIHVQQLKYIKIKDTMYYMYYIYFFSECFPKTLFIASLFFADRQAVGCTGAWGHISPRRDCWSAQKVRAMWILYPSIS